MLRTYLVMDGIFTRSFVGEAQAVMVDATFTFLVALALAVIIVLAVAAAAYFSESEKEVHDRLDSISAMCGMRYSLKDSWALWKRLPEMSKEEMAEYADAIGRAIVAQGGFVDNVIEGSLPVINQKTGLINFWARYHMVPSHVTNMAYFILHAPEDRRPELEAIFDVLMRTHARCNSMWSYRLYKWWQRKLMGL